MGITAGSVGQMEGPFFIGLDIFWIENWAVFLKTGTITAMNAPELWDLLRPLPLSDLRYYPEITSTNDLALTWLEQGAPDSSLIVADSQTKGRGRMQRRWVTHAGSSLAFSFILKPSTGTSENTQFYSPLGALALCQVLREKYQLDARIKWPNDVLIRRRKTCGILSEASWVGSSLRGVVVGIGINIASDSLPPADQVQFPATCMEDETGSPVNRWDLLFEVLQGIFAWRSRMGTPDFFNAWQSNLAFTGEMVRITDEGELQITGKMLGITPDGDLRILKEDGEEVAVRVGDVHLRLAQPSV